MLAYIMSPYTNPDPVIMEHRAFLAASIIAELMETNHYPGITLFSPIVHYHQVAIHSINLPRDVDYWWRINLPYMKAASRAIVLCISGWKESKGIVHELAWFHDNKIKPEFYDPKPLRRKGIHASATNPA